jgi:hypothetical protein
MDEGSKKTGFLVGDRRWIAVCNRTRAFGAELLDDCRRREIGHEDRRHEHRDDDGLCAVDDDVASRAGDGQQKGEDALERELEKLYQAGDGKAEGKSDDLRADRNAPVAEERVTQGHVHTSSVRSLCGGVVFVFFFNLAVDDVLYRQAGVGLLLRKVQHGDSAPRLAS